METWWSEIKQTEDYLLEKMNAGDRLVFEAKMLTSPLLKINVALQKKVYSLIKIYGRKKLRMEIEAVHRKVFEDTRNIRYRESIMSYFKN